MLYNTTDALFLTIFIVQYIHTYVEINAIHLKPPQGSSIRLEGMKKKYGSTPAVVHTLSLDCFRIRKRNGILRLKMFVKMNCFKCKKNYCSIYNEYKRLYVQSFFS